MAIAVVMVPFLALVMVLSTAPFASDGKEPPPIAIALLFGGLGIWMILTIGIMFFVSPLIFRAGFANDLSEGFRFGWALDVAKKMWPTMIVALLMVIAMALVANIVGMLLCFIGLFFTAGWLQLAMADLAAQLYDIYLSKGGDPIPQRNMAMDAQVLQGS